jgi:methionine sulfoxide reductase heme-binding subunit
MKLSNRVLKPVVFLACAAPLGWLGIRALTGRLGADPIAEVLNQLGWWALFTLMACLACTPLQLLFGWTWPIRARRMVGLFAFFYASLHLLTYVGLDNGFDWHDIWADVVKRKFMTVGFAAWVVLLPLAATSTAKMTARLGARNWKRLHRLIYLAGALGVIHFVWRVKHDETVPKRFAMVLALLLGIRLLASALASWQARRARGAAA